MEVTQPMNLAGKSFTVEFWTQRVGNPQEATLFSHGTADNRFEIGLTADDRMKLIFGQDTIVSDKPIPDIDLSWTHLSCQMVQQRHRFNRGIHHQRQYR